MTLILSFMWHLWLGWLIYVQTTTCNGIRLYYNLVCFYICNHIMCKYTLGTTTTTETTLNNANIKMSSTERIDDLKLENCVSVMLLNWIRFLGRHYYLLGHHQDSPYYIIWIYSVCKIGNPSNRVLLLFRIKYT